MLTIDASVWINGDSPSERHSDFSRALIDYAASCSIPVIVPHLLKVEVAGGISRARKNSVEGYAFSESIAQLPFVQWVPLDEKLALSAAKLASAHRLRGADSIYAAVAIEYGCTLVSLDNEHLTQLTSVLTALTPGQALNELKQAKH